MRAHRHTHTQCRGGGGGGDVKIQVIRAEKSDKCKMEFLQLSCSECKNGSIFRLLLKEERVPECMQFIPNHYEWLCCCCCC